MTSDTHPCITQTEWRRVAIWSAIILALTSLPVVVGYLMADDAYFFIGTVYHPEDVMSYLAKMRQGYKGSWAMQLPFTVESHPGIPLLYLPYLLLGHVARWTGASLPLMYHGARVICGVLLLWAAYRFIAFVLPNPSWRWTAFLLTTIAGGFGGWMVLISGSFAPGGITPLDLWPLGHYTFAVLLSAPHRMLGLALFLVILQNVATYWETSSPRLLIAAAVAALAEGFALPFMPLVYGTVLAIAWLLERRWRTAALATAGAVIGVGILPLPIVMYHWLCMHQHPLWTSFANQDLTPSFPIWHYVFGYGLVGILALPGSRWAWREGSRGRLAVLIVAMSLVLAYLPVNFQRRLIFGAHIPLCVLAATGIHGWLIPLWQRWRPTSQVGQFRREGLIRASTVGFSAISSMYVLASMLAVCITRSPGFYLPADTVTGIRWLATETPAEAAILSTLGTGSVIPAYAGRRVFWGHSIETPFMTQKRAEVTYFFSASTSDAERQTMLRRYDITHLFYGPDEQALGGFEPQLAPYLKPMFRHNSVIIYEVVESSSEQGKRTTTSVTPCGEPMPGDVGMSAFICAGDRS